MPNGDPMRKLTSTLVYGVLIWATPFFAGVAIFSWVPPESDLFDSLMGLALGTAACAASLSYWSKRPSPGTLEALGVGSVWALIAVALDAPIFLFGPQKMRMSTYDYVADIGLEYLIVPVISLAIARALSRRLQ